MPTSPTRAAAVLNATTDLSVSLSELLYSPPARASIAVPPVHAACTALVAEARHLLSSSDFNDHDDQADTRNLLRLSRSVESCVDFLCLAAPDATHGADHARANAAESCATVAAAFVLLRTGAFETRLAAALFGFVRRGMASEAWRTAVIEAAPAIIPAMHALVEGGDTDALVEARGGLAALLEVVEEFVRSRSGWKGGGVEDLVEIAVSVVAFATCQGNGSVMGLDFVHRLRECAESVQSVAGENAVVSRDLHILIHRLSGKPP